MIILLFGEDTFRLRLKLNEIIEEYKKKHQSGLNFVRFNGSDLDFDNFKIETETSSMFEEKKLIVLEDIFNKKDFYEKFKDYLKGSGLKKSQEKIIVIFQEGKFSDANFKKQVSMKEEFKKLTDRELAGWIKKQALAENVFFNDLAIRKIINYTGGDLWRINNEINKLVSYKREEGFVEEADIDLLVASKLNLNIFEALDALAGNNKAKAFNLFHSHLKEGESESYLFSMLAYQFRVLVKLKDLIERGVPFYELAKKSGLHPFVVKKSSYQLKSFELDKLKSLYKRLLDVNVAVKSGKLDELIALDLLLSEV